MDYSNIKVLLPEASGRQVLPMAKALKKLGCHVTTVQEHRNDLGAVTRFAQEKKCATGVDTNKEVADAYYDKLLFEEKFDLVIPLSDFSAEIFAKKKQKLEKNYNIQIATNDYDVFNKAYDKYYTMKICESNGIPHPKTLDEVESIEDVPKDIEYPVISKPRSACGSIGLHIANNRDELKEHIKIIQNENLGKLLVQEFIPPNGKQYNAHFVLDKNHNVKTALLTEKCRWFPIDGGASTLCRTVWNPEILEMCNKLLKTINWVGYCDIDLMEDPRDGTVKIIEINARISANVKICFVAGINIAEQLLQLYSGQDVDENISYKEDVRLRCIHTDLLWFIKSKNRFKTKPSWFSFKNTYDQIFSWSDILPFFAFSMQALFKYKKEMKKRKR